MQILVTGGAGFIGSHLVRWLVEQHHQVRILDNFSSGKRSFLEPVREAIDVIEGDICHLATVQSAVTDIDIIFHLAALVSVPESIEYPLRAQMINATGTLNILESARATNVQRIVQASTCAIYGNNEHLPLCETEIPEPLSPYALTKLSAEQSGQLYTHLYGVETVALRFFNVYGPRQDPSSFYAAVIPRFIERLCDGKQPTIYGDGQQSRDFVFVGDVVQALWSVAIAPNIAGQVFNVGSGKAWSILQLAQHIGEILNVSVEPIFEPARQGEVRHSCADVSSLTKQTGFQTQINLIDGLKTTIAAWLGT